MKSWEIRSTAAREVYEGAFRELFFGRVTIKDRLNPKLTGLRTDMEWKPTGAKDANLAAVCVRGRALYKGAEGVAIALTFEPSAAGETIGVLWLETTKTLFGGLADAHGGTLRVFAKGIADRLERSGARVSLSNEKQ